jgi:hypothetical protein
LQAARPAESKTELARSPAWHKCCITSLTLRGGMNAPTVSAAAETF